MNPGKGNAHMRHIIQAAAAALLLLLLAAGCASAEERHTILLECGGGGYSGRDTRKQGEIVLELPAEVRSADGRDWKTADLLKLPDFRLIGAALRFTVDTVPDLPLPYALICGRTRSVPQTALEGKNLWDVTEPLSVWAGAPDTPLRIQPVHLRSGMGIVIREGSVSLQVTFSTSAGLPDFPLDKVRDDPLYDAGLSMLEEGNPFVTRYDDIADSLMTVSLPLGVPYYYAGRSEEKFLTRFYPHTTTNYYHGDRLYFCGLDCVGMTRLIYEKRGLADHPSIVDLLHRGAGSDALKNSSPDRWPALLLPGDLIAVKHGTFHIMMYLGTMRQFGWTEQNAGEAAALLDQPLVLHCGGNPFYYDRYKAYIREKKYRNTYPPDGGVTVAVVQQTDEGTPHSTESAWGKRYGWYLADGRPLLVFPLSDCTEFAWYDADR